MQTDYKITRDKFFSNEEERKIMKYSEERALVDKAKGRSTWIQRYALVHLALYSGLRVSEIRKLQIKNLHLGREPFIKVVNGKRGKDRDVYIDNELAKHLKDFIEIKKLFKQPVDDFSPLFASIRKKEVKPMTTTALTLSFKKAVIDSGLRKDLSIHSARHFYATYLYYKTKNLKFVQNQLGHASLNMTSLYADIFPEENSKLANSILE